MDSETESSAILLQEIRENRKKELKNKNKELKNKVAELKKQKNKEEQKYRDITAKISMLKKKEKSNPKRKNKNSNSKECYNAELVLSDFLDSEIESSFILLQEIRENKTKEFKNKVAELEKQKNQEEQKNKDITAKISMLKKDVAQLRNIGKVKSSENAHITSKASMLKKDVAALRNIGKVKSSKIVRLKTHLNCMSNDIDSLSNEITHLEMEKMTSARMIIKLEAQASNLMEEVKAAYKYSEMRSTRVSMEANQKIVGLEKKLINCSLASKDLKYQLEQSENNARGLKTSLSNNQHRLNAYRTKAGELEEQNKLREIEELSKLEERLARIKAPLKRKKEKPLRKRALLPSLLAPSSRNENISNKPSVDTSSLPTRKEVEEEEARIKRQYDKQLLEKQRQYDKKMFEEWRASFRPGVAGRRKEVSGWHKKQSLGSIIGALGKSHRGGWSKDKDNNNKASIL